MAVLLKTELSLPLFCQGKVRDTYELDYFLLMVATDRISAFDVVLPAGIPKKGEVLNQLSAFWFDKTAFLVPNHLVRVVEAPHLLDSYFPAEGGCPSYVAGRSMLVRKAQRIPVECVVRGYLAGSAWLEYQRSGTVSGEALSPSLRESQALDPPLFTPTTKAESGHDQIMTTNELISLVGGEMAEELREKSLTIYRYAREYALTRGIIMADTNKPAD